MNEIRSAHSKAPLRTAALALVTMACASSSQSATTDGGRNGSSVSAACSAKSVVSGSEPLTFGGASVVADGSMVSTHVLAGYALTSGSCQVCSGPEADPGGPSSYHATLLMLTDDPNFSELCAQGNDYEYSGEFHYLTIQVAATKAFPTGTYDVDSRGVAVGGAVPQVTASEQFPARGPSLAFPSSGTAQIGCISGDELYGAFDFGDFMLLGGDAGASPTLSGTFRASSCPALASIVNGGGVSAICLQCPG